ncbi:MAG: DUF5752 family protein [bacterium]
MSNIQSAKDPFHFYTRLNIRELTGLKARGIKELLHYIHEVPGSVIYYHTHHFLQQHQYLTPEPPNDFAYWVTEMLGLDYLGEQLSSINIHEFKKINEIREKIISVLENYLAKKERPRYVADGEEFHFVKSISFLLPTPYIANNLKEFMFGLKEVTISALYFHIFEARLRLEKDDNDFSFWLGTNLGEMELARKIAKLDPYTYTMESLRKSIIDMLDNRIKELGKGK